MTETKTPGKLILVALWAILLSASVCGLSLSKEKLGLPQEITAALSGASIPDGTAGLFMPAVFKTIHTNFEAAKGWLFSQLSEAFTGTKAGLGDLLRKIAGGPAGADDVTLTVLAFYLAG